VKIPEGFSEPNAGGSPFTVRQTVLWGDMDALAHVNNAAYVKWIENVRMHYFEHIGLVAYHREENKGPILARMSLDFLVPILFPDDLLVSAWTVRLGRSSFTMKHGIWSTVRGDLAARGESVIVMFDYEKGEAIPLPEPIRAAIVALDAPQG
jgi:acyl-CoA thioester hydrolase